MQSLAVKRRPAQTPLFPVSFYAIMRNGWWKKCYSVIVLGMCFFIITDKYQVSHIYMVNLSPKKIGLLLMTRPFVREKKQINKIV